MTKAMIYNASLLVGTSMIGAGVTILWGAACALLTVGALIISMTFAVAYLSRKG
jgi:hypothetical protein